MPADPSLAADHPLRQARWIWPTRSGAQAFYPYNSYAQFRRDFQLDKVPGHAPLHLTADQQYILYVNGNYAARGPARGYQHHWPFDTIDLAAFLQAGHNWLSILAYNPGVSTFQYLHHGRAGLLCAARWEDGFTLLSDDHWHAHVDRSHRRYTARLSVQLNFQEHVDARLDDRAWIDSPTPSADAWNDRLVEMPFGVMPWHSVEPRALPNLGSESLAYHAAVAAAQGPCGQDWPNWENLKEGWLQERAALAWSDPPPAAQHDGKLRFTVPATGAGRFHAVLLDLGRPSIGAFQLTARGAKGGEVIDLFACEWLDQDGGPHVPATDAACGAAMAARLTLRPGDTAWEAAQIIGHRYLTVIVRHSTHPLTLDLALRQTIYPLDIQARFHCDDTALNSIYDISVNTQRICALDAYVDTPWREQAQWWGDSRVQAWNTFHLAADPRLLERGIRQIAEQRTPNGLTYGHAPTIAHNCILPDFSLIWCLTLFDHYWQTGDPRLFVEHWPIVQGLLDYFDTEGRGDHGLLIYDPRYWLFLDWADLPKQGAPTLLNLWYHHTLTRLIQIADVAAMTDARQALTQRRDQIAAPILEHLFDRKANLFHDGLDDAGNRLAACSIHNQTLAIIAGLKTDAHEHLRRTVLLPYLAGQPIPGALPSSYWVTYVYTVMRDAGYDQPVLEHLQRHWAPMIPFGGCTEEFTLDLDTARPAPHYSGTFSHAWAAHPIVHLLGSLGGITQTAPAWRKVRFRPLLSMTRRCDAVVATPHGPIRSNWTTRDDQVDIQLELPPGIEADISLPGIAAATVTDRARWRIPRSP